MLHCNEFDFDNKAAGFRNRFDSTTLPDASVAFVTRIGDFGGLGTCVSCWGRGGGGLKCIYFFSQNSFLSGLFP